MRVEFMSTEGPSSKKPKSILINGSGPRIRKSKQITISDFTESFKIPSEDLTGVDDRGDITPHIKEWKAENQDKYQMLAEEESQELAEKTILKSNTEHNCGIGKYPKYNKEDRRFVVRMEKMDRDSESMDKQMAAKNAVQKPKKVMGLAKHEVWGGMNEKMEPINAGPNKEEEILWQSRIKIKDSKSKKYSTKIREAPPNQTSF
jgi:hypothetical protein